MVRADLTPVGKTGPPERPLDYATSRDGVTFGNAAQLLAGGAEAFPAMLEAIAGAEREVLLESYTIEDDATGRSFFAALEAAARRGRTVRVICDGFGSLSLPTRRLEELEAAGAQAMVYRPVAPWRRNFGLQRRDHRKVLVIDGRIGFVGGLNLSDSYDARTEVGRHWRDLHVRIEGPAVASLGALFVSTWNKHCEPNRRFRWQKTSRSLPAIARAQEGEGIPVQIVGNRETRHRSLIRRSFLSAVRRAVRSVWIANPYFIPDRAVRRALTRAARRGVDVRVLVPAKSDVFLCDLAARATFARLIRAGVRIAEWSLGMMHAKAAAVDGRWATVGSYNLDRRSLRYNLEVTANVYDEQFCSSLEANLRADFERSEEIEPAKFLKRGWWARLSSWLAYQVRPWL